MSSKLIHLNNHLKIVLMILLQWFCFKTGKVCGTTKKCFWNARMKVPQLDMTNIIAFNLFIGC